MLHLDSSVAHAWKPEPERCHSPNRISHPSTAATYLKEPDELNKVAGLRDKYKSELSSAELNAALAEAMAFQPVAEQH